MPAPSPSPARRRAARVLVPLAAAMLASTGASGEPAKLEAPVTLSAATVPATGAHAVDVTVTRFGRYALTATSPQGSAVQLVDRMSGPGEVRGEPGVADGRVDAFLERGAYRLRVISDRAGTGEARVEAHPFVEVGGARPPLLPDTADLATTLADLEQRSWWVQIDADEDFAVELAGRSLADVRLWRDGQWLDPAAPTCEDIAPEPKRPLRRCALTTRLGAGLWQLVAYGGPAVPWSVTDAEQPLYVRRGLPTLADAARMSGTIGPFGTERWLVPGAATTFRLELPSGADAALAVRPLDPRDPFRRDGTVGRIQKETIPPVAEVTQAPAAAGRVVTVSGAPGQAFGLQHFPKGRGFDIRGSGPTWITTLHAGDAADRPDVTGVLVEAGAAGRIVAASLLPLAEDRPYRRKFNVLQETTLGFQVSDPGDYQVMTAGARVAWRWEPYLVTKPKGYAAPATREGAGTEDLAAGRWMLTLVPVTPGVVEVVVRADPKQRVEPSAPHPNVQFPGVVLDPKVTYRLHLDGGEAGASGVLTRPLPVDLATALPLTLAPGEAVVLAVTTPGPGVIEAPGLDVSLGDEAPGPRVNVRGGAVTVTLRNDGKRTVQTALVFTRPEARTAPLPALPDTAMTTPPALPSLTAAAPRALDLARDATATFAADVKAPGLYRVESTGLLATGGAIRTRTRPVLVASAENGVGRNFLLQTYLREGDYQVTVAARGQSAGHLGLRLAPTPLRDGGTLRDGVPARATVPAGEGVAYRFDVADAGDHVLRAFGMDRLFRVRLEDKGGWPVVAPEVDGDLTVRLEKGSYRLVVLPEAVDTTRITTVTRVPEPVTRAGHGPFPLALDAAVEHVWWEPAAGAERAPDRWDVALEAPADVTVAVDAEMTGEIARADGSVTHRLVPGRAWTGRLDAGAWQLRLVNARQNSGVPYTVRVTTRELVPGLARTVDLPAEVPVSVGADSLYEIASMGLVDVAARLFDAEGRVVAASDDRPDDWNFRVLGRLAPGAYTLRVDPVGEARGRTTVRMARAAEEDAPALAAGTARAVTPGAGVLRVPLDVPGEGLLVATAVSAENVGLAVEADDGGAWRTLGEAEGTNARVLVRLGGTRALRLRVTSLDARGLPVTVRADVVTPRVVREGALGNGASAPVAAGTGLGALIVERERPGVLELGATMGVSWCPAAGEACAPVPGALLAAPDAAVWLVAEARGKTASVRGERWTLAGAPGRVTVPAGAVSTVDVAAGAGPTLVFARAEAGSPGVAFGDAAGSDGVGGRAVAVRLGAPDARKGEESAPLSVFAATPGDDGLEIELRRAAFDAVTDGSFAGEGNPGAATPPKSGAAGGTLAGGGAWRAAMPAGTTRTRLVLAEGLVAVLAKDGAPVDTVWAADGARDVTIETTADTLTVLNPTSAPAAWSATARPLAGRALTLAAKDAAVEVAGGPAGRVRVDVGPGVLHLEGAATHARVRLRDGRVREGREIVVPGPGRVEIAHGAGPWVAWIGPAGAASPVWRGPASAETPRLVAAPAMVPLDGDAESFAVRLAPGVLRVRAGQAVVARVDLAGDGAAALGEGRVVYALDGVVEVPVSRAGRAEITLRPFGGGALRGAAEVDVRAAEALSEGVGAEVALGAGEARAWRFTVPADGPVGVGVRTASPDVAVTLYGPDGARIGDGAVQMPTVKAGSYLLVASLAGDAAPAAVRPAVVGLQRPDTGPPAEVVRGYLVAAGLLPPDTADGEAE